MCYDVQAKLKSQLKRAKANNDSASIIELTEKLERFIGKPLFHASGFDHPELLIYTNSSKFLPVPAHWGLIPSWTKSRSEAKEIWNKTLNARSESIFEKPAFRESIESKRCIIPIDGFFEHRHFNGKTYPYFIQQADGNPMNLAGIYSDWTSPESGNEIKTFSIITQKANELMSMIHNNPKIAGPRMPFILSDAQIEQWLSKTGYGILEELMESTSPTELKAHTVQRLKGKLSTGNTESVTNEVYYPELETSLFD